MQNTQAGMLSLSPGGTHRLSGREALAGQAGPNHGSVQELEQHHVAHSVRHVTDEELSLGLGVWVTDLCRQEAVMQKAVTQTALVDGHWCMRSARDNPKQI